MKYRAFIKVAETGNITRAAKELGYSQPGISHMISALEKEMGFPLLIKSRDSIQPTEDGKRILSCCYRIVKEEDQMREIAQSINGLMQGTINIGALNSMMINFIPKIVSRFTKTYPGIEIFLHEYTIPELWKALQNGKIDIAFMTDDIPRGFEFSPLFEDPVCLAVNRDHPFAAYDKLPVSYLNGCDFIMNVPGCDDLVIMIMKQHPFTPTTRHYTASDMAGISMVSENLGVLVIPKLQEGLLPANVVAKEFKEPLHRILGICTKSFKHVTPALKEFISITYAMV